MMKEAILGTCSVASRYLQLRKRKNNITCILDSQILTFISRNNLNMLKIMADVIDCTRKDIVRLINPAKLKPEVLEWVKEKFFRNKHLDRVWERPARPTRSVIFPHKGDFIAEHKEKEKYWEFCEKVGMRKGIIFKQESKNFFI